MWNVAKAVLSNTSIDLNASIKRRNIPNQDLNLYHRKLAKQSQLNIAQSDEIIKIRAEINKGEFYANSFETLDEMSKNFEKNNLPK